MAKLLWEGGICYSYRDSRGGTAESLSGTDQTHTAMRQERVTGSIPKVGEGEVRCGSGGGGGGSQTGAYCFSRACYLILLR